MSVRSAQRMARKIVYRDQTNEGLLNEIESLESCLEKEGGGAAVRRLPFGCRLQASRETGSSKTILQIFFDPLRFRAWTEKLEPVEFLYMNPCGLELIRKATGHWGIYLDGQELFLNLKANEPYEMARLESRTNWLGEKEIVRVK